MYSIQKILVQSPVIYVVFFFKFSKYFELILSIKETLEIQVEKNHLSPTTPNQSC